MIFDEKCIIINKEKGAEYIMNKSENYYKKKDKLFNKIFFIPMFFFVLLCILVCFTKDGVLFFFRIHLNERLFYLT